MDELAEQQGDRVTARALFDAIRTLKAGITKET